MMPKRIMCNWTHEETLVLLCCLDEFKRRNEVSVKKDRITVDDMFREVSTKLWKMGFAKSNAQIRCKWRNMKKKYKIVKAMNLTPTAAVKEWRYFSQLAKLMGKGSMASWVEDTPATASSASASEVSKKISTVPLSTRVTRNRSSSGADVSYAETPPESSRAGSNQSSASDAASGSSSSGRTRQERNTYIDGGSGAKPSCTVTRSAHAAKVSSTATPSKSSETVTSLVNDSGVAGNSRRYDTDMGASTSASNDDPTSISREFYLDFCKQQMDFMQQSHTQQLSWFKSQMEINQQHHVQQQTWFHEQMVLQRQKEEELMRRQFEHSKIMTESIVYRLFDGMCQLADNIFNKAGNAAEATPVDSQKKSDALSELSLASGDPTSSPARCVVPPVNLESLACSPTASGEADNGVDCVVPDESSPTQVLQITQPFSMMDTSKSNKDDP